MFEFNTIVENKLASGIRMKLSLNKLTISIKKYETSSCNQQIMQECSIIEGNASESRTIQNRTKKEMQEQKIITAYTV